jgi:hypothetical protein
MGSGDDRLGTATRERMSTMMTVQAAAARLQSDDGAGAKFSDEHSVALRDAEAIIEGWPDAPKKAAMKILDHYGPPNEATPTKLFWYRTGPWARMELTANEVLHKFPMPHVDFFTQYVDYPVSAAKTSELLEFDGSVILDRTAGQIGARCDDEAFNVLTLNLAVEILEGRRTVEDARELYAETAAAYVMGRDAPYAERLLFDPQEQETADPDEVIIASGFAEQVKEKFKDLAGQGEPPQ